MKQNRDHTPGVWVLGSFLVLGLLVYAPSLAGPFQYDDKRVILDAKVRDDPRAWGYGGIWGTRALSQGSFWLDWRLWGEKTVPYHVENLLIHVFASFLVFALISQIMQMANSEWQMDKTISHKPYAISAFWLSAFGGAVFLLHPLQTQAVAYISQRFESMAAMFYLLAIVLYLKSKKLWAFIAGMAAASSKEIAITLPIMLLILELLVIRKKLRAREWLILASFWLISVRIVAQIIFSADWGGGALNVRGIVAQAAVVEQQEAEMTRVTYLMTQFNVLRTYLRLLVLPVRQSLDYDYPLQTSWDATTIASLGLHLGVLGVAVWLMRKQPLVSLGIAWFYLTLLPTSSLIPIRDVIYEHRVYLAMVGWALLLGAVARGRRWPAAAIALLLTYSLLTLARNTVWASEVKLWQDAWKKAPNKDRTNKNYGFVLTQEKRFSEGIARLERAVELKPEDQDYRITLGAAYLQVKEWDKARAQFEQATKLRPEKADGWNNLGVALFQLKRYEESKQMFLRAIELDDRFYMAWLGLGGAEIVLGHLDAAQTALNRAVEIDPKAPEAYRNLAILGQLKQSR